MLAHVGPMLAHVGPMLAHVGPMLAHVGSKLGVSCLLFNFFDEDMQDKQNLQKQLENICLFFQMVLQCV